MNLPSFQDGLPAFSVKVNRGGRNVAKEVCQIAEKGEFLPFAAVKNFEHVFMLLSTAKICG